MTASIPLLMKLSQFRPISRSCRIQQIIYYKKPEPRKSFLKADALCARFSALAIAYCSICRAMTPAADWATLRSISPRALWPQMTTAPTGSPWAMMGVTSSPLKR